MVVCKPICPSQSVYPPKGRPTTACSRPPTARIINHALPAKKPLVEVSLAGPAAADAEALGCLQKRQSSRSCK
jgi:hypothetical protein